MNCLNLRYMFTEADDRFFTRILPILTFYQQPSFSKLL